MRRRGLGEIIKESGQGYGDSAKIKVLRENDSPELRLVIRLALDPAYVWLLPLEKAKYTPTDYLDQEGRLYKEVWKLGKFLDGHGGERIREEKRRTLFVQLLESLAPLDAELLNYMKAGRLYNGVTKRVVDLAFPGWLDGTETDNG
jgi:hypothetical protein